MAWFRFNVFFAQSDRSMNNVHPGMGCLQVNTEETIAKTFSGCSEAREFQSNNKKRYLLPPSKALYSRSYCIVGSLRKEPPTGWKSGRNLKKNHLHTRGAKGAEDLKATAAGERVGGETFISSDRNCTLILSGRSGQHFFLRSTR